MKPSTSQLLLSTAALLPSIYAQAPQVVEPGLEAVCDDAVTVIEYPAYFSTVYESVGTIFNFMGGTNSLVINNPPETIVTNTVLTTTVTATTTATVTADLGAAAILGAGLPTGTVTSIPSTSPFVVAYVVDAVGLQRLTFTGPDGSTTDPDDADAFYLQDGELRTLDGDKVGRNESDTYAAMMATPYDNDVTTDFFLVDGMLRWDSPDRGEATFYDCGGNLFAGFPDAPFDNCTEAMVGAVAVDALYLEPGSSTSTSSTSTSSTSMSDTSMSSTSSQSVGTSSSSSTGTSATSDESSSTTSEGSPSESTTTSSTASSTTTLSTATSTTETGTGSSSSTLSTTTFTSDSGPGNSSSTSSTTTSGPTITDIVAPLNGNPANNESSCAALCPSEDDVVEDEYIIYANQSLTSTGGNIATIDGTLDFQACIDACSLEPGCVSVSRKKDAGACFLHSTCHDSISDDTLFDSAERFPDSCDPNGPSATTTTSPSPTAVESTASNATDGEFTIAVNVPNADATAQRLARSLRHARSSRDIRSLLKRDIKYVAFSSVDGKSILVEDEIDAAKFTKTEGGLLKSGGQFVALDTTDEDEPRFVLQDDEPDEPVEVEVSADGTFSISAVEVFCLKGDLLVTVPTGGTCPASYVTAEVNAVVVTPTGANTTSSSSSSSTSGASTTSSTSSVSSSSDAQTTSSSSSSSSVSSSSDAQTTSSSSSSSSSTSSAAAAEATCPGTEPAGAVVGNFEIYCGYKADADVAKGGADLPQQPNVQTLEDCIALCTDACTGLTYNRDAKLCYRHTGATMLEELGVAQEYDGAVRVGAADVSGSPSEDTTDSDTEVPDTTEPDTTEPDTAATIPDNIVTDRDITCTADDDGVTDDGKTVNGFDIYCSSKADKDATKGGASLTPQSVSSLQDCIDICAGITTCQAVTYGGGTCYPHTGVSKIETGVSGFDGAVKASAPDNAPADSAAPPACATLPLGGGAQCPGDGTYTVSNDGNYYLFGGYNMVGGTVQANAAPAESFADCEEICTTTAACHHFSYLATAKTCTTYSGCYDDSSLTPAADYDSGTLVPDECKPATES